MLIPGVLEVSVATAFVRANVPVLAMVAFTCSQSFGLMVVPPLPPPLTLEAVTLTTGVPPRHAFKVAVPPLLMLTEEEAVRI